MVLRRAKTSILSKMCAQSWRNLGNDESLFIQSLIIKKTLENGKLSSSQQTIDSRLLQFYLKLCWSYDCLKI